jgi:hypothetical protein
MILGRIIIAKKEELNRSLFGSASIEISLGK